jgi:ribosomal-protein-alanine N-acetyltransferase
MSDEVLLRAMTIEDLPEVLRIERLSQRHAWTEPLFTRELAHDIGRSVVASRGAPPGGPLCGFLVIWLVHDELHILNVATDPTERRQGVGRRLMLEAERLAAPGAVLSTLEVRRSNAPAIALYESLGYEQVGVRPRYYQEDGEDAFVMTKRLRDVG